MPAEPKPGKPYKPKTGMILAAGLGTRMRPLTQDKPKAMIEVLGKPLIGHMLDWFAALELETIVINLHYKPDPLVRYLEAHSLANTFAFIEESPKILDTGGGVKNALSHLGKDPFLVANCDAFFNPRDTNPFEVLLQSYEGTGVCLLLANRESATGYDGEGDFDFDPSAFLKRRMPGTKAPYVFTGLQILDPIFFQTFEEKIFSLNKIYDLAIKEKTLKGILYKGGWHHIGTPKALKDIEELIKSGTLK